MGKQITPGILFLLKDRVRTWAGEGSDSSKHSLWVPSGTVFCEAGKRYFTHVLDIEDDCRNRTEIPMRATPPHRSDGAEHLLNSFGNVFRADILLSGMWGPVTFWSGQGDDTDLPWKPSVLSLLDASDRRK